MNVDNVRVYMARCIAQHNSTITALSNREDWIRSANLGIELARLAREIGFLVKLYPETGIIDNDEEQTDGQEEAGGDREGHPDEA